jgi:tetratricopeptide (TPR) repeat protein
MSRNALQIGKWAAWAALCLALLAGCSRVPDESREARDRNLRRAAAAERDQDIDQAIIWCEKALKRRPDLTLAHRKLGLMLQNYRQDYVGALYHYNRYLQLRPESEVRDDIEGFIQTCRLSYAAQIAASPDEMKRELQARDARIRVLEQELAAARLERAAGSTSSSDLRPAETASATAAPDAVRIHVVEAGENLATISTRYYGTPSRWKHIFNANQGRLTDANNVRVGTRLEIPND